MCCIGAPPWKRKIENEKTAGKKRNQAIEKVFHVVNENRVDKPPALWYK